MRLPAFMVEHPGETVLAGLLLLALIFGGADKHAAELAGPPAAKVATAR